MGAVRTILSMEEFLQLPELDAGKRELVRGELVELPPAKEKHNEFAHRLFDWLRAAAAASEVRGRVRMEKGYRLGPRHWLQPDISITYPDQPANDYLEGAPRLAVEIVSEDNTPKRIAIKVEDYLAHGGEEVWVVYPEQRHMWIHRTGNAADLHNGSFPVSLLNGQILDLDQILGD